MSKASQMMSQASQMVSRELLDDFAALTAPPQNSPSFPKIGEIENANSLSQKQLMAIEAIMAGANNSQAATQAGVDRKTLYNWRRSEAFRDEIRHQQRIVWQASIDRVRALVLPAIDEMKDGLEKGYRPDRLRAAGAILRLAGLASLIPMKDSND